MTRPKMICVTGSDGAGKTTQIVRLAERLERGEKLKVAVVTIWDLLLDLSISGKVGFEDPGQVDRYLGALAPTSRALFLYHCLSTALDLGLKKEPDVVLLNAYWYKYCSTEVAHGGDLEQLTQLARVFPEPDVVFHLRLGPEAAAARKAVLSSYETGFAPDRTKEAFLAFQRRAQRAMDELARSRGWIDLDGSQDAAALTHAIVERLPALA